MGSAVVTDILAPLQPSERFNVHTIPLHLVDRVQQEHNLRVFIETGTYLGLTVEQVVDQFDDVYTIELDPKLVADARWKFQDCPNVHVLEGDSGQRLAQLFVAFPTLTTDRRALLWLDAHYSGGVTALTDKRTPILAELDALHRTRNDHVLMIDDLADFNGEHGYPTLDGLVQRIKEVNRDYNINIDMHLRRGVMVAL